MQIIAGIILLAVLIVFHELGHFLFAKWLGVRVLVFSVGFGPKICSFRRGETEYRISAIPLGGYVRMFGESLEEELTPPEKRMSFMHQPIWRKSLIAFAGPLFNFILPIILFFFLLIGTEKIFAPKVGTLIEGGVAQRAGLVVGDRITTIDKKPVLSFGEVADIIAQNPDRDLVLGVVRTNAAGAVQHLTITVRPESKVSINPLEKDSSVGRIGIMPAVEVPKVLVSTHSPLRQSGLQSFDDIIGIDDKAVANAATLSQLLMNLAPQQKLRVKRGEQELTIVVPRELAMDKTIQPITTVHNWGDENFPAPVQDQIAKTHALLTEEIGALHARYGVASANGGVDSIKKDSIADNFGFVLEDRIISVDGEKLLSTVQLQQAIVHDAMNPHVLGVIKKDGSLVVAVFTLPKDVVEKMSLNSDLTSLFGISTMQVFTPGETFERNVGPLEAVARAAQQTLDIGLMTAKSLWLLLKMEVPASQIGGPIMLFDVAQQAAQKGLSYYIFIMCLLSVNLGLLNLLPIPALDGGHLLLFGIEAVQRKPLTPRTRTIATQIGVALLLMMMAIAIFNDMSRLLS